MEALDLTFELNHRENARQKVGDIAYERTSHPIPSIHAKYTSSTVDGS